MIKISKKWLIMVGSTALCVSISLINLESLLDILSNGKILRTYVRECDSRHAKLTVTVDDRLPIREHSVTNCSNWMYLQHWYLLDRQHDRLISGIDPGGYSYTNCLIYDSDTLVCKNNLENSSDDFSIYFGEIFHGIDKNTTQQISALNFYWYRILRLIHLIE